MDNNNKYYITVQVQMIPMSFWTKRKNERRDLLLLRMPSCARRSTSYISLLLFIYDVLILGKDMLPETNRQTENKKVDEGFLLPTTLAVQQVG